MLVLISTVSSEILAFIALLTSLYMQCFFLCCDHRFSMFLMWLDVFDAFHCFISAPAVSEAGAFIANMFCSPEKGVGFMDEGQDCGPSKSAFWGETTEDAVDIIDFDASPTNEPGAMTQLERLAWSDSLFQRLSPAMRIVSPGTSFSCVPKIIFRECSCSDLDTDGADSESVHARGPCDVGSRTIAELLQGSQAPHAR